MKELNGLRNHYTPEYKANIVREILREEKSVAQIAAEHGIHPHQLYQWRDQALQALPTIFSGQSAREQAAREQAAKEQAAKEQAAKEQAAREEAHSKQVHELYAQIR